MKLKFTIVFLLVLNSLLAQKTYEAKLIDEDTKEPLPFANIYIKNKKVGTYSNLKGEFSIKVEKEDTIIISYIAYETTIISVKQKLNSEKSICIKPLAYNLKEVIVTAKQNVKTKNILLGYSKLKTTTTLIAYSGAEVVSFIPNNLESDAILDKVILNLKSKGSAQPVFRIHLYSVDKKTNLPGKELLNQDIIGEIIANNNIKKIDVGKYNILLPKNGVFIGIEWIGELSKNNVLNYNANSIQLSIPITFKLNSSVTYYKAAFYNNNWDQTSDKHPLSILLNKNTPPNAAFGLELKTVE